MRWNNMEIKDEGGLNTYQAKSAKNQVWREGGGREASKIQSC